MKIKFTTQTRNYKMNEDYHAAVLNITEGIFTTHDQGWIPYVMSSDENTEHGRGSNLRELKNTSPGSDSHQHISTTDLGPCETEFLNRLKNNPYPIVVVTGALGSGKSTLIKFVIDHIKKTLDCKKCTLKNDCILQDHIVLYFDFNKLLASAPNDQEVIEAFDTQFYFILKEQVREALVRKKILTFFEEGMTTLEKRSTDDEKLPANWQIYFMEFRDRIALTWPSLPAEEKIRGLFSWITSKPQSMQLLLFTQLLACIRNNFPEDLKGCFLVVFDNIDRLSASSQKTLIDKIKSFTQNTMARTVIPVRLTTYSKFNESQGAFNFDIYEHAPPIPSDIVLKRVERYLLRRPEYLAKYGPIERQYLKFFDERMRFIYGELKYPPSQHNKLSDTINAFAGHSIRRGLYLCERLILNNVFPYTSSENNKTNNFKRALIVGQHHSETLNSFDASISNIFFSPQTKRNSFLCIRILQLLIKNPLDLVRYSLSDLLNDLSYFHDYSKPAISECLQYLSDVHKRLVFFLSTHPIEEAISSPTLSKKFEIEITHAGRQYLDVLLHDLSYTQECFLAIDWSNSELVKSHQSVANGIKSFIQNQIQRNSSHEVVQAFVTQELFAEYNAEDPLDIPTIIDQYSLQNRLQIVRKVLRKLLIHDALQMTRYCYHTQHDSNRPSSVKELITCSMIAALASSVVRIIGTRQEEPDPELFEWYNLCIIGLEVERAIISDSRNQKLLSTIHYYKSVLELR